MNFSWDIEDKKDQQRVVLAEEKAIEEPDKDEDTMQVDPEATAKAAEQRKKEKETHRADKWRTLITGPLEVYEDRGRCSFCQADWEESSWERRRGIWSRTWDF